jgi:hypothetical protein
MPSRLPHFSIESDPPARPIEISFDDEPLPAVTDPAPARASAPRLSSTGAFLRAWLFDTALACALTAACAFATLRIGRVRYPFDFLRDTSHLWFALAVSFAVAWSFFANALRRRRNR